MDAYPNVERQVWVTEWPGQTVLCVSSTYWTSEVHEAIRSPGENGGLPAYLKKSNSQLDQIIILVRGKLATQTRITLGKLNFF